MSVKSTASMMSLALDVNALIEVKLINSGRDYTDVVIICERLGPMIAHSFQHPALHKHSVVTYIADTMIDIANCLGSDCDIRMIRDIKPAYIEFIHNAVKLCDSMYSEHVSDFNKYGADAVLFIGDTTRIKTYQHRED